MRAALVLLLSSLALPLQAQPARDLDRAFEALREAPDEAGGRMAEAVVAQLWARQASPAVALLLNRGIRTLRGGGAEEALEDFDAAITLAPRLADAWHWRAQAQARAGDRPAALADLRECLRLEPRHFGALLTLSRIEEEAGNGAAALRAMEAALAIHPRLPGGTERLRDLVRKVEGERS